MFQAKTVGVSELKGFAKASKASARAHDTDDPLQPRRQVAVLHIPPVT
jgi:hypothetical protein